MHESWICKVHRTHHDHVFVRIPVKDKNAVFIKLILASDTTHLWFTKQTRMPKLIFLTTDLSLRLA